MKNIAPKRYSFKKFEKRTRNNISLILFNRNLHLGFIKNILPSEYKSNI
ncbi:hypothetical protein B194_1606 [Serratia plymuthica A30]|nr:hypothetical protein B194_1606 [Serratia plymuthica A30]